MSTTPREQPDWSPCTNHTYVPSRRNRLTQFGISLVWIHPFKFTLFISQLTSTFRTTWRPNPLKTGRSSQSGLCTGTSGPEPPSNCGRVTSPSSAQFRSDVTNRCTNAHKGFNFLMFKSNKARQNSNTGLGMLGVPSVLNCQLCLHKKQRLYTTRVIRLIQSLGQSSNKLNTNLQDLPHFNIREEIIDAASNRFVLKLSSETSV